MPGGTLAAMPNAPSLPPLRWLSAADVEAAMPAIPERLALAERTLIALATPDGAELPPKLAIHPRPAASFIHAMPAIYRGPTVADDLVGMKWVAGYATNTTLGLPGISAVVVLNDAETGIPTAILDGGPITAQRTAAVSGVAIRRFGPSVAGRTPHAALIGAGVQGHSHLPIFGHVLPGVSVHLFDRDRARAERLASAARGTPGIGDVAVHDDARSAVEGADVVLTAASFGPAAESQSMTNAWLNPEVTVVPIDYATYCAAEVARDAALFLVDHAGQYLANRDAGNFEGYPDPDAMIGAAILAATPRPAGRVVVTHLGVGLADILFADAIVRAAATRGLGIGLQR